MPGVDGVTQWPPEVNLVDRLEKLEQEYNCLRKLPKEETKDLDRELTEEKLVEIVIGCVPDWCQEAVELARETYIEQAGTGCWWEISRDSVKESRHSDKSVRQPSYHQLKIQLVKSYDQRRRSPDGQQQISSHPWMYFTPPTKSRRNHTKYVEDDVNGVTTEDDIGNVETDEKEQKSGHFVDVCGTATKDETETNGSSSTAEHVDDIRSRHFRKKPLRRLACWFYADGRCRSGDSCLFRHDGPLNRKGKTRARRDSASAHALSSWNSRQSEYADVKEETRKTKRRAGTFADPQDWKRFMKQAASAKIKVEADEKLHQRVRRNDMCMMMRSSQESSYMIPQTKMARKDTSLFELDENPPINKNDHSEGLEGLDKNAQTDNGCSEDSSGLDEIPEQTSTAVRNEDIGLEENPKFMKDELNRDREVMTGAV